MKEIMKSKEWGEEWKIMNEIKNEKEGWHWE
jgi:hypothetical protein